MNVGKLVGVLATASIGAVVVKEFVATANLTGSAGTIAGLFTFLLIGGAGLATIGAFGGKD